MIIVYEEMIEEAIQSETAFCNQSRWKEKPVRVKNNMWSTTLESVEKIYCKNCF